HKQDIRRQLSSHCQCCLAKGGRTREAVALAVVQFEERRSRSRGATSSAFKPPGAWVDFSSLMAPAQRISPEANSSVANWPAMSLARASAGMIAMTSKPAEASTDISLLEPAGFAGGEVSAWLAALPELGNGFEADSRACTRFWSLSERLRAKLPPRAARSLNDKAAGELIHRKERGLRDHFLSLHAEELYGRLTARGSRFLRLEELMPETAKLVPGLTPGAQAMAAESVLPLGEKEGLEIDHGILLSHILAHPALGRHLCHAMLLPRPETFDLLRRLEVDGTVDLGLAHVSRVGKASFVELRNPRALNGLDETTLVPLETAIDLAILDRGSEIAVLRGGIVNHPKYAGRRIFSAGINLTHLYQGKISFLFYFQHVMGYENKIHRGVARRDVAPDDLTGSTTEKPWIAVVDTFAIGGGCQHLLVMDYVLAEAGAYLTLPARKEG